MSRWKPGIAVVCLVLGLVAASCSSKTPAASSSSTPPASSSTPTATGSSTVQATGQLTFDPVAVTVKAGQTVTWKNSSGIGHTVTFDSGPSFDKQLPDGSSVSRTFTTAGTYNYHCTVHGQSMHGTITVT